MAINLADKYDTKLDERYKAGSFTDRFCGSNYNWEGVNAIKVWNLVVDDLNDYTASGANRYGTPTEVEDEVTTYALTKKRSFTNTIDITNAQDQMFIKKANAYLKMVWDEKYVPEIDKYRLTTWANGAYNCVLNSSALTKSSIITAIRAGHEYLDDECVPSENRVTFVSPAMATLLMFSDELKYNQNWTDKTIVKGKITELCNSPVVQVPSSRLPAGCNFIIKYKNASADPNKLRKLKAHVDAPGYAGTLLEGLCRYDSFVLANKAKGIYAHFQTGACAAVTGDSGTTAANKVTLTCTTAGTTIKYTIDGTNPKTSSTALTYSTAFTNPTAGTVVKAYASKTGLVNSGVFELTI